MQIWTVYGVCALCGCAVAFTIAQRIDLHAAKQEIDEKR